MQGRQVIETVAKGSEGRAVKMRHESVWPSRGMEDSDMEAQHWPASLLGILTHLPSGNRSERASGLTALPL